MKVVTAIDSFKGSMTSMDTTFENFEELRAEIQEE